MNKLPITNKQQRFVEEYVIDCDATNAAIRAGFSPRTAYSIGHALLGKPLIADAITEARARLAKKAEASAERVIAEFCAIAFLDPDVFYDDEGNLLPIRKMPERARRAITGMDVEELFDGKGQERRAIGRLRKIRFAQKQQALDALAKHLGLFRDGEGNTVNQTIIFNQQINELLEDADATRQFELILSQRVGRVVTLDETVAALRAALPAPEDDDPEPGAESGPVLRLVPDGGGGD